MNREPQSARDSLNRVIVDSLISPKYLELIENACAIVANYAREVLASPLVHEAANSMQPNALNWLKVAASNDKIARDPFLQSDATAAALELAKRAYPGFLSGEANGTNTLFSGNGLKIWQDYYKSTNPHYAPLNEGAAVALLQRATKDVPLRVLEIGAGTGGASTAALNLFSKTGTGQLRYLLTDISVRLLQATAAEFNNSANPGIVIEFERYDMNQDRSGPLVAAGEFDVILAVNALHNASELTASLLRLCRLLKKDGVLIISESICGVGQQVHQEFFLNLLPMPDHRKGHQSRFLSSSEWRLALQAAELEADIATNSLGPELMLLATVSAR